MMFEERSLIRIEAADNGFVVRLDFRPMNKAFSTNTFIEETPETVAIRVKALLEEVQKQKDQLMQQVGGQLAS